MTNAAKVPWIGLVHVKPAGPVGPLGEGRLGAYANIVALASGSGAYKEMVSNELDQNGLLVVEFEDVQPASAYAAEDRISEELKSLIESLTDEYPVQYKTFHAYREHDV